MKSKIKHYMAALWLGSVGSGAVAAEGVLQLTAKPGAIVCQTKAGLEITNGLDVGLCVSQGNFNHDRYVLKFGGKEIVTGIDDQTTNGLEVEYQGRKIKMVCTPQSVRGNATVEDIRKSMPGLTEKRANEFADLVKGSFMGMEVGRLCDVSSNGEPVMAVQVLFE
jgi:hypothetical protein